MLICHLGGVFFPQSVCLSFSPIFYFLILFVYFRERGREGEREEESLAYNPGMLPDWGLNPRPFGLQASTQSTDPHQPALVQSLTGLFFY